MTKRQIQNKDVPNDTQIICFGH